MIIIFLLFLCVTRRYRRNRQDRISISRKRFKLEVIFFANLVLAVFADINNFITKNTRLTIFGINMTKIKFVFARWNILENEKQ